VASGLAGAADLPGAAVWAEVGPEASRPAMLMAANAAMKLLLIARSSLFAHVR
jgi:hypothetical protein